MSGLSIVDLCIQKKATLEWEATEGHVRPIDARTTLGDLQGAKSIRVRVLA